MPWGRLLDVIFMLSGHLLGPFWTPFGCLWDAFSSPGHPWEPFYLPAQICLIGSRFYVIFGLRGAPPPRDRMLTPFWYFCRLFGSLFLHVFLIPNFSDFFYLLLILGSIWDPFSMLFGVPGNLENGARTLTGVRFSHFGPPFFRPDF